MALTIDAAPVIAALNRIASWNRQAWFAEVGARQKHIVEQRIQSTKVDPEGRQWPPWRESTRRQRIRKGNVEQGLLWDTGELLHSITVDASPTGVEIGTNVEHGKFLQEGTHHMVAREFVGWAESDHVWLETSLVAHLNAIL